MESENNVFEPRDYQSQFNPRAYLDHLYGSRAMQQGMKLPIFALPRLALRIPKNPEPVTLLDVGSGPTIHTAMCFRNHVDSIYLSDFADQNRTELLRWLRAESDFDWSAVAQSISASECDRSGWKDMESITRSKIAGILRCDVHCPNLVQNFDDDTTFGSVKAPNTYDIVISIYCLESACTNYEQYCKALEHIVKKLKPGGYLVIGSVLEDTCYQFGPNDKFTLLYLTEQDILDALHKFGIDTTITAPLEFDGAYMVMGMKK